MSVQKRMKSVCFLERAAGAGIGGNTLKCVHLATSLLRIQTVRCTVRLGLVRRDTSNTRVAVSKRNVVDRSRNQV